MKITPEYAQEIGQAVRILRQQRRLSRHELGVNSTTIWFIESGKYGQYSERSLSIVMKALELSDASTLLTAARTIENARETDELARLDRAKKIGAAIHTIRKHRKLFFEDLKISRISGKNIEDGNYKLYRRQTLKKAIRTLGFKNVKSLLTEALFIKVNEPKKDANYWNEVGEALLIVRDRRGWLQNSFGIHRHTIRAIEGGKKDKFSEKTLDKVIQKLGYASVQEMITDAGNIQKSNADRFKAERDYITNMADAVRMLRWHKDLSQSELGVPVNFLSRAECGIIKRAPDKAFQKIFNALGLEKESDVLEEVDRIKKLPSWQMWLDVDVAEEVGMAVSIVRRGLGITETKLGINSRILKCIEKGKTHKFNKPDLQRTIKALGCKSVEDLLEKTDHYRRIVATNSPAANSAPVPTTSLAPPGP